MTIWIWTVVSLIGFSVVGKCIWIVRDDFPMRTRAETIVDVVVNSLIIGWGLAVVLF